MLDKNNFRNYLFSGFMILSAGIFFLFTSEAIYLWSDLMIVNTMLRGISSMSYLLFAFMLIQGLFSGKKELAAQITILLYGLFISVLIIVPMFTKIYFYDMLGVWPVGAALVSVIFTVSALHSAIKASGRQKLPYIFISLGLILFLADIAAVYFGFRQTGLASKIYFLIGFMISVVVSLRIVPKNIKAAKKAEQLEKEKITLDAELARSRISTLMSQIQLHFIYNTLAVLNSSVNLTLQKRQSLLMIFQNISEVISVSWIIRDLSVFQKSLSIRNIISVLKRSVSPILNSLQK